MPLSAECIKFLSMLRLSGGRSAIFLANHFDYCIETFLTFCDILPDRIIDLIGDNIELSESTCMSIFRYGWLSPNGEFTQIRIGQHDATVINVTGFYDCDQACAGGWVKFTVGLPYNHRGECLFESDADKRLLSMAQRAWLNEWLASIAEEDTRPRFLGSA